jgi:hypothetical protein
MPRYPDWRVNKGLLLRAPVSLQTIQSFTGSNGATPTGITATLAGNAAAPTIQGNKMRLNAGTAAFSSYAFARWDEPPSASDGEFYGTFTLESIKKNKYVLFAIGTDGPDGSYTNVGIQVEVDENAGTAQMKEGTGSAYNNLGSSITVTSGGLTGGATYGFRLDRHSTTVKWKCWTGSEPGWIDSQTTTVTTAGKPAVSIQSGLGTATYYDFDDFTWTP